MATNHYIRVRQRRITVSGDSMPSRGKGSDTFSLDLDSEWDGLSTLVILGSASSPSGPVKVWYKGGAVEIPEATMSADGFLPVSVVGYDSSGSVRLTTYAADRALLVSRSGEVDGSEPTPEPPDLYGQLLSAATEAESAAVAANDAASKLLQDAEEGRFDGAPGAPGKDGVIPFATCDTASGTQEKAVTVDGFSLGGGVVPDRPLRERQHRPIADPQRVWDRRKAHLGERRCARRGLVVGRRLAPGARLRR